MRISAKILDGIAKAVKGFFDVGTPIDGIQTVSEFLPFIEIAEGFPLNLPRSTAMGMKKYFLDIWIFRSDFRPPLETIQCIRTW